MYVMVGESCLHTLILFQNYGSEERVSVMAIGDPHVLHLNASNFSLCNSPGETLFFSSFVRHRQIIHEFKKMYLLFLQLFIYNKFFTNNSTHNSC